MITIAALLYALAILFAIAFWRAWHKASRHSVSWFVYAALAASALIAAIDRADGLRQLLFGVVLVAIPWGCILAVRDNRHDRKQEQAAKITTDKVAK